jgi:polar amino acid transport system permease protein
MSKFGPLKYITKVFVWIIRGTPLMLQVIIVYYGPGLWFDLSIKNFRFAAVIVAFVINYACYFSEIYRGGIESISKGQYEAGYVLGMSKAAIFFRVILPQVVKRILPSISNEVITLVKDTSLARVIAIGELIRAAEESSTILGAMWPLLCTGLFYLIFSGLLTILFNKIEKKMDYYKV